jgi:phosphatidylinositol glycan class U
MILIQLHAVLLLPLFHRLWLTLGTGNANFLYAATLLYGLANGMAILDTIWAGLRIAVGKGYEGKDIEVIQK